MLNRIENKVLLDSITNKLKRDYSKRYYLDGIKKKKNTKRCYVFRYDSGWGVWGVFKSYIFHYYWAINNGYIPVLDYEAHYDFDKGVLGRVGGWDAIFEQEVSANEAINRKGTIIGSKDIYLDFDIETCEKYNSKGLPFIEYRIEDWRNYYCDINRFMAPIFRPKRYIIDRVNEFVTNNFRGKVLGIIMREDFSVDANNVYREGAKELYERHPLLPATANIISEVKYYFRECDCQTIFVSTMFTETIDAYKNHFGSKVKYIDRKREDYSFFETINDTYNGISESIFELTPETIEKSAKYVEETMIASKCDYLIVGPNSQSTMALAINGGKYREVFFLDDKRKIQY